MTHVYSDGPATHVIQAFATDEDGTYGAAGTVGVTVLNVAPALTLRGADAVHPFTPCTLDLAVHDPGADTIQSWRIDWGDGVSETVPGNFGSATHTYPGWCGAYTIWATALDEDGAYEAGNTLHVRADFGNPNQCYVAQVYFDLLGRGVEPGGLAHWSGLLDQGHPRLGVAQAIQHSLEYRTRVVHGLYRQLLLRDADPLGLDAWARFLAEGGTAEQLRALLLGSAEYFARHGGTVPGFLRALYRDALSRDAEESGLAGWSQAIAQGTARGDVALAVLRSREADGQEAQGLYHQYLRRPADPAGHQAWVEALQRGMTQE